MEFEPILNAHDAATTFIAIGLASNVGLTGMKAVAGVMMNSASLLAEAGHSLSDLLGVSFLSASLREGNAHVDLSVVVRWDA